MDKIEGLKAKIDVNLKTDPLQHLAKKVENKYFTYEIIINTYIGGHLICLKISSTVVTFIGSMSK